MQNLNSCNCCEGITAKTPLKVYNQAGLKAISYRIGNYSQFRESLLNKLSSADLVALNQLTTRANDDFTIALLDAWAIVADVLTFYQERIANESYLNTAIELRSVLELARLIGYELSPGVAATTYIAFTVDENHKIGLPSANIDAANIKEDERLLQLEKGIKIQSVPEPEEKAQTFETIEAIEAKAAWNAIKVRTSQVQTNITTQNVLYFKGTNNNIEAGDIIMLISKTNKKIKRVQNVYLNESLKHTKIVFSITTPKPYKRAAIEISTLAQGVFTNKAALDNKLINNFSSNIYNQAHIRNLVNRHKWSLTQVRANVKQELETTNNNADTGVFVFRKSVAVFGYNAPKQLTYNNKRIPRLANQWQEWVLNEDKSKIYLDSVYKQVVANSYVLVQQAGEKINEAKDYKVIRANARARNAYGISSKTTELTINADNNWWKNTSTYSRSDTLIAPHTATFNDSTRLSAIRNVTIHAQSETLQLAQKPITTPISGDKIELDELYLELKIGQALILSGKRVDLPSIDTSEIRFIKETIGFNGITLLQLDKPLKYEYIRDTVRINANVALATHGESVQEILGNGDATKAFQKFVLKQPPLTYTSAATASGIQSSLQIRVNDILWKEVPTFYGRTEEERIYITRQNDNGQTTVCFGDGINGARLPSGQQNIKAYYRKGIGTAGLLKARQLSQLTTLPLGVREAVNPLATSGAQNSEQLADARNNATLNIYTLDRIVSLQDYEDFACAFAGISKAYATSTWCGKRPCVHLTVAGANGATVSKDSVLYKHLLQAIQQAAIPDVLVVVDSFQNLLFQINASIQTHPDYIAEQVLKQSKQALYQHFSFKNRQFGQAVALSEVVHLIQNIAGVIAVDVNQLYRIDKTSTKQSILKAKLASPNQSTVFPAELLTIIPDELEIQVINE